MQVIKAEDCKKYFCPMKYTPSTSYTERCDGPRCMWWKDLSDNSIYPYKEDKGNKGYGFCGK
jgi:hypothetical protein